MHEAQRFLQDLALVLSVAAVVTILFHLLRQPIVLGYLLAGVILGPHVPIPLFADRENVGTLAELGVILVMFSIGLELSVRRLVALLPTSGLTGLIQIGGMFWLGHAVGQIFGWNGTECLVGGAMVAISSTMIATRALAGEKVERKVVDLVFGVLVVQDLAAVVIMAALTAVAAGRAAAPSDAVLETVGELAAFLVAVLVVGFLVVPRSVRALIRLGSRETILVASVGFCFALALLAHRLGYSVALGAFLAGSLVAESGHGEEIERLIAPLRDLFAAIFFVAVGMMVDPRDAAEHWAVVLALGAAVLVGQSALVAIGTFLAGNDLRSSIRVGMSLAQIGEFSFIIAGIGTSAGAARDFLYPVAVAVCILTSFTTPWMVRRSGRVARAIESRLPHALQTFASLYGSWREQLRERARRRTVSARIRRQVRLLLLDGALLAALLVAGAIAHERYAPVLAARLRLGPGLSLALVVGATALVALPFAIGLLRLTRGLGTTLARVVLPAAGRGELDLAAAPRRAFRVTVQLGVALLVGLPFLALTRPFLPFWMGLALLGLALFGLGIAFWRSARNLDEHVRAGAHLVLEVLVRQAGRPAIAQRAPLDQVATALPGLGHLTAVTLEPGSPAVGRTLIELDLRGSTGASVIAIGRASGPGEDVAAPTGREVLAVGDILTLTGTSEAVGAAAALLLGESASPAPAAILPR